MAEHGAPRVIPGVLGTGGAAGFGLEPDLGPLFFVVGAFDGLHRGHTYLLAPLARVAVRHGARPGGDHLRPPPRRGPGRLGAAGAVRSDRATRPLRPGRRRGRRRAALRRDGSDDAVPGLRRGDRRPGRAGRLPDDPGCRLRPRAARHADDPRRARPGARLRGRSRRAVRHRRATTCAAPRSGPRSRRGELQAARQMLGRSVAVVGRPEGVGSERAGPCRSPSSCRSRCRRPGAIGSTSSPPGPPASPGPPGAARRSRASVRAAACRSRFVGRPPCPPPNRLRIRFIGPAPR